MLSEHSSTRAILPEPRWKEKGFDSTFNFPSLPDTLEHSCLAPAEFGVHMNNVSCMRSLWIRAVWPKDAGMTMLCLEQYSRLFFVNAICVCFVLFAQNHLPVLQVANVEL